MLSTHYTPGQDCPRISPETPIGEAVSRLVDRRHEARFLAAVDALTAAAPADRRVELGSAVIDVVMEWLDDATTAAAIVARLA